jgi:predicted NAD/FAD-dependent oxidoreductase
VDDNGRESTPAPTGTADVLVVGAGISGLAAARRLQAAGRRVTVVDKGRSVGGRLATRRISGARVDHGAQFFTQRGPEMAALLDELRAAGSVHTWCRGFAEPDGHPRYVMAEGMTALAKHLARDLTDVQVGRPVERVERRDSGWSLHLDDGTCLTGVAVLLTAPLPQSLELLDRGGVELDAGIRPELDAIDYDAALAVLVVLDGPSALPPPGAVQLDRGPFTFVADNRAKGISPRPALTLHTSPEVAARRWDEDDAALLEDLLDAAAPWIGDAGVVEAQLKRWRYAAPRRTWPEPCCVAVDGVEPLVFAGDAFDGPRIEGAYRSGLAAGTALLRARPGGAQDSSATAGRSSAGSKPSTRP